MRMNKAHGITKENLLASLPAVEICSESSLAGISFSARETR